MRRIFAVQLIVEDTEPVSGFASEESFIEHMKNTFFEDFPEYKILSVDTHQVFSGEEVRRLEVYRSENQFVHFQEAE